jgi:GntR family transcriptional regulator
MTAGTRSGPDRQPLPIRVRDGIRALIAERGLRPGDRLPTEHEIGRRFEVGRTTVREALKLLEQDGLVEAHRGSGHFVSPLANIRRPISRLESVTEMMRRLGYDVTNRVVSVEEARAAAEEEAEALGVEAGSTVIRLERVRLHDDEPLIYSLDVMPRALVPAPLDAIDWTGSLFVELERQGVVVTSALAEIRAVRIDSSLARRIGVPSDRAWLQMIHRNLDASGQPVVYSHDYYRGDVVSFTAVRRRTD